MDRLKEARESRVELEQEFTSLVDKAKKEKLSTEETTRLAEIETGLQDLDTEISSLEAIEKRAGEIAKRKAKVKPAPDTSGALPGPEQDDAAEYNELKKIASQYSIGRAVKSINSNKPIDGAEKEVNQIAIAEAAESKVELSGNIHIPHRFIQMGKRSALTVGTEGTDVVFTEYGGKVIPYLNPEPIADMLGVTFLQGLNGDVQWPRESGDLSFGFETETSDVNETTPTFDNISISPKRFGGYVDVTMQMLQQSVFVIDSWLRGKLNLRYGITVDEQIFIGTGASNQTTGLFNTSGVNVLSLGSAGGDMTYAALLDMMRSVKASNARRGSMGWATNANGEFALARTPMQSSGVEGNFVYKPDIGTLIGRRFETTEIIPSTFTEGAQSDLVGIAYSSNWAGLIAGFWGGLDILFDPYTQRVGGKVRFVCNAFMDVDMEQPAEFAICKDWDATDLPGIT